MKKVCGNVIALSLLSTINAAGVPAHPSTQKAEAKLKITVRVYNRSRFSPETVPQAMEQTARILQQAGIEASWFDCLRSTGKSSRSPDCDRRPNATDIELRLVPLSVALASALPKGACGLARPAEPGGFGQFADVFSDCVENASAVLSLHPALLLGHVIAHEIGHLLLGENAHYPSGLMKIKWNHHDLQHMAQEDLLFTAQQSERIRSNVLARRETSRTATVGPMN